MADGSNKTTLVDSVTRIQQFQLDSLATRLSTLEHRLTGKFGDACDLLCNQEAINVSLLSAALTIKQLAGQVNVIIHASAILLLIPRILEPGEVVQSVSLGAGNTNRDFDLETDRRIAEFKFISWRGGSESIRQNSLFKDFYWLAEHETHKSRYLYVLGLRYPQRFLEGKRALSSVLSRDKSLYDDFQHRYGQRFQVVRDYYHYRQEQVNLLDVLTIAPDMFQLLQP